MIKKMLKLSPKALFLIDGLGAIVTAFFLRVVLVKMNHLIGMNIPTLELLFTVAVFLAFFSLTNYFLNPTNWQSRLKFIAFMNFFYAIASAGLLIFYRQEILPLGYLYFIVEILIILFIARIEYLKSSTT